MRRKRSKHHFQNGITNHFCITSMLQFNCIVNAVITFPTICCCFLLHPAKILEWLHGKCTQRKTPIIIATIRSEISPIITFSYRVNVKIGVTAVFFYAFRFEALKTYNYQNSFNCKLQNHCNPWYFLLCIKYPTNFVQLTWSAIKLAYDILCFNLGTRFIKCVCVYMCEKFDGMTSCSTDSVYKIHCNILSERKLIALIQSIHLSDQKSPNCWR